MRLGPLFIVLSFSLISGCDNALKASDYRGGFFTQSGNCTETGDVGITIEKASIEIGFYCFLKECSMVKGKTSQGGYFHIEQSTGHYIQGRLNADEAKGTWYLKIKGQDCSGHWAALKN